LQARRMQISSSITVLESLVGNLSRDNKHTTTSVSMTPNNNSTTTSTTMETPKPQALSSPPNNNWTNCSDVILCNINTIDEDCSFHDRFPPSLPPIQQLAAAAAAPNETATPNYKTAYQLQTLLQQRIEVDEWKRKLAETQTSHAKEVKLLNSQYAEALAKNDELHKLFLTAHPNAQRWTFDCELHNNWQAAAAAQLDEANAKYTALQNIYIQDTLEWQSLVEVGMDETNFDGSHRQHQHDDEEESLDYSEQENNQELNKEKDQELYTSIDAWEKEMGQSKQEGRAVLQEIHTSTSSWSSVSSSNTYLETTANMERVAAEMQQEDHRANVDTITESSALDKTISILNNLKDSIEKGRSVLEQLEGMSEMMQDEASSISTLQAQNRSWTLYGNEDELRQRIAFLEHDLDEVVEITNMMLDQGRESHQAELQAAVATTKQKAHEELQSLQIKQARQNFCLHCQRRIDGMLEALDKRIRG
jgi:hypothetical protein